MDEVDVRTIQYAMEEAECAAIDAMNEELLLPLLLHQLLLKITSIVGSEVMVVMIAVILAVRGTQEPFFDIDQCSNRIIGVAKFEYMGPYLGVLSHMDRTLRCSSHYFGGDLPHNRHWRVVDGARLRVPAIIDAVGFGLQRPSNMMFAVTPDSRDQLLASPLYGSESLANDFLTNWGVPAPASVDTVLQLLIQSSMRSLLRPRLRERDCPKVGRQTQRRRPQRPRHVKIRRLLSRQKLESRKLLRVRLHPLRRSRPPHRLPRRVGPHLQLPRAESRAVVYLESFRMDFCQVASKGAERCLIISPNATI